MQDVDYLIVGAGAVGMIFADQLITETGASIAIVDRHSAPGGHWNDAYPFVRLHQPATYYGAGSRPVGENQIDTSGLNAGLYTLPTGAEVRSYFAKLMSERFLASGRVQYFPECDYQGAGEFVSASGARHRLGFRKLVNAAFFKTQVPGVRKPGFEIGKGVAIVAPNALPELNTTGAHFVLLGAGKTAMDAASWLLLNGAPARDITWVKPREAWLMNREMVQPGDAFLLRTLGGYALQLEAAASAQTLGALFARLEADSQLLRIDRTVQPTMYRGATVTSAEVALLRSIEDIVRMGHVRAIAKERIVFDDGALDRHGDTIYVDCSANPLNDRPPVPVFDGKLITPQIVRAQLVSLSAAAIAHVEAAYDTDEQKNALCRPIPAALTDTDWALGALADLRATERWGSDRHMRQWSAAHRLTGFGARLPDDAQAQAIRVRIKEARPRAMANLERLLAPVSS
jgi:hypothetical protein